MSRLTKKNGKPCTSCESLDCLGDCRGLFALYNKLAHYEDLEEQGRLIVQKHGRWIYTEDNIGQDAYCCCNCGWYQAWNYKTDDINFIEKYHYCPNCGAKMLKGTEE